mgnify:FL=1
MDEQIIILPVLPTTFEYQEYSQDDNQLISASILDTVFSSSTDYIEYYAYDENQNLVYPNNPLVKAVSLQSYRVLEGDTLIYPAEDLENYGFVQGKYFSTYNFYRTKLSSSIDINYYIDEISSDRTEVRLKSTAISNESLVSSSVNFIEERENADYFVDFLLNFGDDQQVIANNIQLDNDNPLDPSILVKLYEPLPSNFGVKSLLWVVEEISSPQAYSVQFPQLTFESEDLQFISGPNFSLNIKNQTGESGQLFSFNDLINSDNSSSYNQLTNILDKKEIDININYEDYSQFVNFSSAKTRLENFVYKVGLIQSSSAVISSSFGGVEGGTTGSFVYSASKASEENKIKNIIRNFDGYEYFLYFNSGSKYSYPKTTSTPPYVLAPTSSAQANNWQTQQAISASNYDDENNNSLYFAIPEYLRSDPNNARYELFVDMVGQHYDNIWVYTKDLTNRFDGDNRLDYGISKDLVADAIRNFGVKLYANNFNVDDLYTAFLGLTPSGSTFPNASITSSLPAASGFEYVDTKITASNDIIPLDDANKRLYKRIYHNLPYLLKTKGTIAGLRSLITSYGIPDTILRINEFGGKDRISTKDWDLKQDQFNKAYELDRGTFFSSSFVLNSDFRTTARRTPSTLQFRFKTIGTPTASLYQNVWAGNESTALITLEYTGSGLVSGSYSGSVPSASKEFGTMRFYPEGTSDLSVSASVQVPFFNKDWWSVQANIQDTTASLFVGNKYKGNLQYTSSDSITGVDASLWNSILNSNFPTSGSKGLNIGGQDHQPLTGSLQEIRYWNQAISESKFLDYVVNPYSNQGNTINSAENTLIFRAGLGSELNTSSRESIHPRITGSWDITQSFKGGVDGISSFVLNGTTFSNNKEQILLNQTPGGIKNRVSDKIQIVNNSIPSGSTLSPFRKVAQSPYISGSEPNVNYLEVAFSPQDQINDDIIGQIGAYNLGDYIGDPRQVMQNRLAGEYVSGSQYPYPQVGSSIPEKDKNVYNYPTLDALRDAYFLKYINSYDVNDFIRLIKFFDNSLFKMIEDFTPARTTLTSGVVIKQNLLERNRYAPPSASFTDETISGSVKPFSRDYNTGSSDYPQYNLKSGSSIYTFKGGTGGVFEEFNTEFAAPVYYADSTSSYSGLTTSQVATSSFYDRYPQVTQSFTESVSSSVGLVTVLRDDQREFYDGEFQAGGGSLNFTLPEICKAYFGNNNIADYFYRVQWFFGQQTTEGIQDLPYIFNTTTNFVAPPAIGDFLLNNATQTSATKAQISRNTDTSTTESVASILNNLSTATSKGSIRIANRTDNSQYLQFPVTAVNEININSETSLEYRFSTETSTDATNPRIGSVMADNSTANAATKLFLSFSGSKINGDNTAFFQNLITSSNNPGYSAGYIRLEGGLNNTSFLEWDVNGYGVDSSNPSEGQAGMVSASLGSLRSSSAADPFSQGENLILKIIPTASGDWYEINLGTVASSSATSPFSNDENLNIQFIPTSSFQPVAPQFVKDEEFFLSERNCPGDGYAWFWTPTNQEGQKAKYIKISNKSANNQFIQQFVPYSDYVTFKLTEARTGGISGSVIEGFQTWNIGNVTVMDDGIPATADCTLIFVQPEGSSYAVNSNDDLFTDFSFSASGQFIWYATASGVDPNVTPALNLTQSSPQGYFPPVPNTFKSKFPTTQFQRGWADATWYGNSNGVPTYMGTGSGFLFDPNGNFNTGSKEFDADYSSSVNNLYQPSTKPWYMNAAPSQSMITSSLFNTFTITNDFTSSTVLTRFLSESIDFGPVYTVNTASEAVQVDITSAPISLPSPTIVLECINLLASPTGISADPPVLSNSGGTVPLLITNPAGTSVNYSASIEYLQPMNTTNHSIVLGGENTQSWVHFSGTSTGTVSTGVESFTIETRAGFAGVGFVTQQRSARINLFQQIDGVFTNVNPNTGTIMPAMRCLIIQTFNIQQGINTGGNQNLGDDLGGIINPITLQP